MTIAPRFKFQIINVCSRGELVFVNIKRWRGVSEHLARRGRGDSRSCLRDFRGRRDRCIGRILMRLFPQRPNVFPVDDPITAVHVLPTL